MAYSLPPLPGGRLSSRHQRAQIPVLTQTVLQQSNSSLPILQTHGRNPHAGPAIIRAELMRRVFSIDVLECLRCGGRMRIIAAIHPPEAIRKILDCLGLPSRAPPIATALPDREIDELNFS